MDDQDRPPQPSSSEPVRSRWTPKPDQIQILENIFNSGTVNPAKDETVKIRKILEQYGSVGDANVFYWFQNRRSRSRRRQRQLQAAAAAAASNMSPYDQMAASNCSPSSSSLSSSNTTAFFNSAPSQGFVGDVDSYGEHDWFSVSRQMNYGAEHGHGQNSNIPSVYSSESSQLQLNSGTITVFINGIQTEVPRGAIDMRAMFGPDVVLVHSSGEILPANDYGVLLHSLQMGESYFLVSKSS